MIIYIAGYGRSGSTILDIVLSNAENGITLGEINSVFNEHKKVTDSYFAKILNETIKELKLTTEELETIRKADKLPLNHPSRYADFWKTFISKIHPDHPDSFLVDSSKTTWDTLFRPYNLSKSGFNVRIIFLKASYSKVWKSTLKGSNKSLEKNQKKGNNKKHYLFACKSVFSKFLIDSLTQLIYLKQKNNVISINYQNFINKPSDVLKMIAEKLEVEFVDLNEKVEQNEFLVKGGYLGNRLRKENATIRINKGA